MTDNNIHMSATNNVKTLKQLRISGQATVIEQSVIEEEQYEIVENNNQVQQQQHVFLEPASATIITGTHPEPDYEDLLDDIPLNPTQPVQYDDDDLEDEETLDEEEIQNHPPPNNHHVGQQQGNYIARLRAKENILLVSEHTIEIGRNSSKSNVHFHVSKNNFVSRKHLILQFEPKNKSFYLMCLSKNGVFVDGIFQRKGADPLRLARQSIFRFPSTNIRIEFENLVNNNHEGGHHSTNNKASHNLDSSAVIYSPLKIAIPDNDKLKSPYPSPTGTISAANSCPTSPRQGYHDFQNYHGHSSSHTFSNEPQAPSTSSNNEYEKPPYSYAQLIVQSISASPEKQLTLSGIYSFISKNYPYYRTGANKGWQNSIRHNLSLNRYFIKVPRSQDEPGKGSFWRIDPLSEMKLIDQSYRKRRQRGSQCFRTPYGMPRSAPVSPTHMDNSFPDNSRENSPLNDVIMQSAPGSPGSNNNYNSNNHREDHSFGSSSYKSSHHTSYDSQGGIKRENDLYDEQADYLSDEYETVKRQKTN